MVRTAARLLRRQGYAATGWRQVVADSETPWGSQAHHFPGGKEQLVAESLTFAAGRYERLLKAGLDGTHPADFVATWAELAAAELEASGWADGCPVATVTLEMAHQSETVAAACGRALGGWLEALTVPIAARGVPDAEARDLATLVIAAIEGGLILARAQRNGGPLRTVGGELSSLLRARVPA